MTFRQHFYKVQMPIFSMALIGLVYVGMTGAWEWLIYSYVMWFLIYIMGETIFYHRYFSHRTFECRPWLARLFSVLAMMGGQGGPITYRAVHIGSHHAHSDTVKDIHSPVHGFWHACLGWFMKNHELPIMASRRLLADPFYVKLEQNIVLIWWTITLVIAAIDWRLAVFGIGVPGLAAHVGMAISNAVCHTAGTRRYATNDNSRNNAWLGMILIGGEGLHNNHHAFPGRYHDSHAWYEIDVSKWIIPLIATKINHPNEAELHKKYQHAHDKI